MKIRTITLLLLAAVSGRGEAQDRSRKANTPPPIKPPLSPVDVSQLSPGTQQLDLYLLLGQSNMKGRGVMPPDPMKNPRIINMHLKTDDWYLARHPLHLTGSPETFKGHDNAGVGPGLAFAEVLAEKYPKSRIGLVPCAVGGSAMSRWTRDGPLYKNAIRRAKLALSAGPEGKTRLRGAIWLQGEADSREGRIEVYADALSKMIEVLRSDLGVKDLPFIACTIGEMRAPAVMQERMNRILLDLPPRTNHTGCVDARDLTTHIGDSVHFDTAAQEQIGQRFAHEFLRIVGE